MKAFLIIWTITYGSGSFNSHHTTDIVELAECQKIQAAVEQVVLLSKNVQDVIGRITTMAICIPIG